MGEEANNPEMELANTSVAEEPVDDGTASAEDQTGLEAQDDGNGAGEDGQTEDDGVDVEYDGKQYRVPKELKDALLRQADYTTKTQELAAQRQAAEQFQQAAKHVLEVERATLQEAAQLAAVANELQQFNQIDFNQLSQINPAEANRLWIMRSQLQERAAHLNQRISQNQAQALQSQQFMIAKMMQEGQAVLSREIPDWSESKAQEIRAYAKQIGYSDEVLNNLYDAKAVVALHKAMLFDQHAKAGKAKGAPAKPAPKPAAVVKGKTASAASLDPSKMTDKQFAEWRQRQKAQRGKH